MNTAYTSPARDRFPHLAQMEDGTITRVAEVEAMNALDLIDAMTREIARLNAALMGENAPTAIIHSARLGRTDDYAVFYRGVDVGLCSFDRRVGQWYAFDADGRKQYCSSRLSAERRVVLTYRTKVARCAS